MKKYIQGFENEQNIFDEFRASRPEDIEIIFASYGVYSYEGDAFVLFKKNGKLYEVNGSHCSCMGLEKQWEPEETTIKALKHRFIEGSFFSESFHGEEAHEEMAKLLGVRT